MAHALAVDVDEANHRETGDDVVHATSDVDSREQQRRAVADAWLAWQCRMVAGVVRGAVFSTSDSGLRSLLSHWPANDSRASALGILAAKALEAGESVVLAKQKSADITNQSLDHIAIPIANDGGEFVVVMHIVSRSQSQQQAVIQLVQWGGMWLGSLDTVVSDISGTASNVSAELAEQVLSHNDLYAACLEASNRLATDLKCDRVSVGLKHRMAIQLQSISQVSSFDERRALVRAIEAAMEEAVSQQSIINISDTANDELVLTRAHEELRAVHGAMVSCTIPLYSNGEPVGAVLLERASDQEFPPEVVNHATKVLAPMGPVLQLIRQERRSTPARARDWLKKKISTDSLPETTKGKVIAGACTLGLLGLLFIPVTHNVSASARIEGSDKQVLVAPHDGYIKSAQARAGDRVAAGDVIASLEVRELSIERAKWLGELEKLDTSLARALSQRDRTELGLLQAKKAQVDAELALIDQKISRSQLSAPFDGVLVSGDLNQSLGSPVEAGQVLFEVASMEDYRLVLEIDEHDVAGIESNQAGVLRFSALPGNKHEITTTNIVPVAITKDRRSVFSVEATFNEATDKLRPGMRGIAKVKVGEKPLIWIWTHGVVSKLRLWLWKTGL